MLLELVTGPAGGVTAILHRSASLSSDSVNVSARCSGAWTRCLCGESQLGPRCVKGSAGVAGTNRKYRTPQRRTLDFQHSAPPRIADDLAERNPARLDLLRQQCAVRPRACVALGICAVRRHDLVHAEC